MEQLSQRLGSVWAELLWLVYRLRERLGGRQTEARSARLRALLRANPTWSRGHVLLGFALLQKSADARPEPRTLASIRVSGEAAVRLEREMSRRNSRTVLEGKYLLAMAAFLSRDYAAALVLFRQILALNNVVLLRKSLYFEALENGGATALAVGDNQLAFDFFSKIPSAVLTREGQQALELLRSQGM